MAGQGPRKRRKGGKAMSSKDREPAAVPLAHPLSARQPPLDSAAPTRRPSPDRAQQSVWVQRLRQGDSEALREVVQAFSERLSAVVAGLVRDDGAVEDIVQESFIKAWQRIASFAGSSSLYTWLYRIAVNTAKDHLKMQRRRPAISLDALPDRGFLASRHALPIEGLERREARLRVERAIAQLPVRFRTVLALREIEEMSYQEIASVLGLSVGTVESRLFRARSRLRRLLTADGPLVEGTVPARVRAQPESSPEKDPS